MDANTMKDVAGENAVELIRKSPLEIFKTNEDITGRDITKMSNFFDGYIQQMSLVLREHLELEIVSEIPVADLNVINEVVERADVMLNGSTTLVPDFDTISLTSMKDMYIISAKDMSPKKKAM